jgi:hypothetical protein
MSAVASVESSRRCEFQKSSQLFLGTHYEPLPVAMRVNNPDYLPLKVQS